MHLFAVWLFAVLLCARVHSTLVNVTVDDTNGDQSTGRTPSYAPALNWNQGGQCSACGAVPDASQAFDNTWHDSTAGTSPMVPYTMTVTFKGTAVYVFCILANQIQGTVTTTFLSFTIDGESAGPLFTHIPDSTTDFIYNALVFSSEGLSDTDHTLVMSSAMSGDQNSLVLFDYVIYTTDSDPSPSDGSLSPASMSPSPSSPAPINTGEKSSTSSIGASSTTSNPTTSSHGASPSPSSSMFSSLQSSLTASQSVEQPSSHAPLNSIAPSSGGRTPVPSASITVAPRPSASHTSAIIGGVVGGIAGAVIFGLFAWLCKRRHDKHQLRVRPTNVTLTRHRPEWTSSKKTRERAALLNTSSLGFGFGSAADISATDARNTTARRRDELERQVRELEEQNPDVNFTGGQISPSASQACETSTETEVLQRQVRSLLVNMRDLQAQQRELEGQIAPPIYDDDRLPNIG